MAKRSYSLHPPKTLPSGCVEERKDYEASLPGQEGTTTVSDSRAPKYDREGVDSLYELAVGCAYVLIESAFLVFPTSDPAKPSRWVRIMKGSGAYLRPGDDAYVPQSVNWKVWQRAVVPVLENETLGARKPLNRYQINHLMFEDYVRAIEGWLLASFREQGFLPP
jgi:hypothetical protein